MKKQKEPIKKNPVGAPHKHQSKKIGTDHLRDDQREWLIDQAAARDMGMWKFVRWCVDVARTLIDTKNANVDGSAMFDDILKEGGD